MDKGSLAFDESIRNEEKMAPMVGFELTVRGSDGAHNKAKSKSVKDDESEIKVEVQHTSHCSVGLNLVLTRYFLRASRSLRYGMSISGSCYRTQVSFRVDVDALTRATKCKQAATKTAICKI